MKKTSTFKPAWWLKNPHLQTLWSALMRQKPMVDLRHEVFELSDGDFIELAWVKNEDATKPLVIVLHGLGGSVESPYMMGILNTIQEAGWRGVAMHFRGCGTQHNRLQRGYHAGDTADLNELVEWIVSREPNTPIAAVGYSLGGNVLLKWLGETGERNPLTAAIAVSVPFDLTKVLGRFNTGFSKVYSRYLLQHLRESVVDKLSETYAPVNLEKIKQANTFTDFDDNYTAPLHGFANAYDYYQRASSRHYLKLIEKPTLILHAEDDPFMTPDSVPTDEEISDSVMMEISPRGGHVGFVGGRWPWDVEYWLEDRIHSFFSEYLDKKLDVRE